MLDLVYCVHNIQFNAYFDAKFKKTPVIDTLEKKVIVKDLGVVVVILYFEFVSKLADWSGVLPVRFTV
jgi:hypothetical protein